MSSSSAVRGGWASIALSSLNPPQVKAIITFAAGRGGRVGASQTTIAHRTDWWKRPANSAAHRALPMLWIYIENDTFFGPALSKRMHEAFTAAGGKAEYRSCHRSATRGISSSALPTPSDLVAARDEISRRAGIWKRPKLGA